ncbi:MAG: hypothetical protein ACRDYA_00785 [Egibacteraceae bacterium]
MLVAVRTCGWRSSDEDVRRLAEDAGLVHVRGPAGMGEASRAAEEQRRNEVALELAALDLMSEWQIRLCAEIAGLDLPDS